MFIAELCENVQRKERKRKGKGTHISFFSWDITGFLQWTEVLSAVLKSESVLKATGILGRKRPTIALRSLMIHSQWRLRQNYFPLKFNAFLETTRRMTLRNVPWGKMIEKNSCYIFWRTHNYLKQRKKIIFGAKHMTSSLILSAMNTSVANRCSIGPAGMIHRGEDYSKKQKRWGNAYYSGKKNYGWATFESDFSSSLRKACDFVKSKG